MRRWLRRIWIKFELWNLGYCTKHGVERKYDYSYDGVICAQCSQDRMLEHSRFEREATERTARLIAELKGEGTKN